MPRALVIANPIAGRAKAQHFLDDLQRELKRRGIETTLAVTAKPGDARERAASQAAEHDVLIVVGGDGTLNEALNGLAVERPIAVCPHGTGNVLAKELGLPRRLGAFCKMVAAGRRKALDVARVGGRRFVSMASAGFDAAVVARLAAKRAGSIGMSKYAAPLLRCFATYRFPRLDVCIDDGAPVTAEGFVLVSNVRAYGGPFVVARHAVHDDGLLDVCILPRGSRLRLMRAILACMVGARPSLSGLRYFRGRRVRVTSQAEVHYQVDGDPVGVLPATFELAERKQSFIVP